MDFIMGERVLCTSRYDGNDSVKDAVGTVITAKDERGRYGVEFDEYVYGHSLRGRCEDGYGFWIDSEILEPLPEETLELPSAMSYEELFGNEAR